MDNEMALLFWSIVVFGLVILRQIKKDGSKNC
jgi:hypothetical protein